MDNKTSDKEKIMEFESFMRGRGMDEETILYNKKTVSLLSGRVLTFFQEGLEEIDTYTFEEFTDMVTIINDYLGGRDGIPKMLSAMLLLTEFLKEKKYIKGGKIAYYKRMFSKTDYYLEKYDMMTGKGDDTKSYIKKITSGRMYEDTLKLVENINLYDLDTMIRIDKLLNDVPLGKQGLDSIMLLLRAMLVDLNLMDVKDEQPFTTKKGRAYSRLPVEERYAAMVHMIFDCCDWKATISRYGQESMYFSFSDYYSTLATIFSKRKEVSIKLDKQLIEDEDSMLVEIASDEFRMARLETMDCGMLLMDLCFIGMGMLEFLATDNSEVVYRITELGQGIMKQLYSDISWTMKNNLLMITGLMKNKKYEVAEAEIIGFLSVYGPELSAWNCLGQALVMRKQYKLAYHVLKFGYENSSKRGKVANTVLYYLVMCCRKLKLEDDIKNYEIKLQTIEKK